MTLPRKRMLFGLTALAGIATLLLVMTWSNWAPETEASNEAADTVMSMQIDGMLDGSPVHCDTANGDTKCTLDDGGPFTVAMIPSTIPPAAMGSGKRRSSTGAFCISQARLGAPPTMTAR